MTFLSANKKYMTDIKVLDIIIQQYIYSFSNYGNIRRACNLGDLLVGYSLI